MTDNQQSIRNIISNSGTVLDRINYDAYGNIITNGSLAETNASQRGRYAWTGRELDVETSLQYNRARYYDSGTGRWISQDPMGFDAGDSNLYRYVGNMPTEVADPSGRTKGGKQNIVPSELTGRETAAEIQALISRLERSGANPARLKVLRGWLKVVKRSGKFLGAIGVGIGIFYFAENAEAHGVGGAVARATPVLGDYIGLQDGLSDESADFLDSLNRHSRIANQRTAAAVQNILEYELQNRPATNPDVLQIQRALVGFYNELQHLYYMEAATGRSANINDAVQRLQAALDHATLPGYSSSGADY